MRFAGESMSVDGENQMVASAYEDRLRQREEAKIIYKMIMKGELGDPSKYTETLKELQNQISGIGLKGV